MHCQLLETKTGTLLIKANTEAIISLKWEQNLPLGFMENPNKITQEASVQLGKYFNGEAKNFSLKIAPEGTDFQKKVWDELLKIPYGKIVSYKNIADEIGTHPRPVGGAVGANPIPILIPCHRVVGENGNMVGFSGGEGIKTKKQLLKLEGLI